MSSAAIASALERVLTDDGFRADLQAHGLRRARMFSWDATARRALDAFESFGERSVSTPEPAKGSALVLRLRLRYPVSRSTLGWLAQHLFARFARLVRYAAGRTTGTKFTFRAA